QRSRDDVVIEGAECPSHQVASDELTGIALRANHVDLILYVTGPRVGSKSFPFQHEARVMSFTRYGNFAPVVVSLAPICRGPVFIQRIDDFVFVLEPILK